MVLAAYTDGSKRAADADGLNHEGGRRCWRLLRRSVGGLGEEVGEVKSAGKSVSL